MPNDAHSFWNGRATLGAAAGSNDIIAKKLEIEALANYVRDGYRILDFGCGNGVTALELASRFNVDVYGIDYSEEMIGAARELASGVELQGAVRFRVGDVSSLNSINERFDLIYTERVIINLRDWKEQSQAITLLTGLLLPGGAYAMCENSQDGLEMVNSLRSCLHLPKITPPWHNRYLKDDELESFAIPGVTLENINYYSSTYYFLSRVINAALAAQNGVTPEYASPVNQLALRLPPAMGRLGQGRIWLWRKDRHG
jgi:ubiquinone/menaquinone biosynthesis C-methylase UbiE